MARSDRIQVTVSPAMLCALDLLAERNTLTVSAQATLTLRQALDRTIGSAECLRRLRAHTATRNHATWLQDQTTDRAVERLVEAAEWSGAVVRGRDEEEADRGAAKAAVEMEGA
jgi:hypothetical protein